MVAPSQHPARFQRTPPIPASLMRGSGYVVVGLRRLATFAAHEPVERLHVGPLVQFGEELGRVHRRQLLGHGSRHKLIDAGTVFLGTPLDLGLD
jgi:hypothetical protein